MASVERDMEPEPVLNAQADVMNRPYRSFKKKYFKLRHVYRGKMKESNDLYEDEENAKRIARRLQEQNDQLLELLLDINASSAVHPHHKYDLQTPPPEESAVPDLISDRRTPSDQEVREAQAALHEAQLEHESGHLDAQGYEETEKALLEIINHPRSLTSLSKISHSTYEGVPSHLLPLDIKEASPVGLLSPSHEEEYLSTLDNYLDSPHPENLPLPPSSRPMDRERERDAQLHNPVSVFNWLSNHRPKFLEDDNTGHDKPSKSARRASPKAEKPNAAPVRSSSRRERGSLMSKHQDDEVLDDEGNVIGGDGRSDDFGSSSQRKRKRGKDDDAYRPKGGGSRKRKRPSARMSNSVGSVEGTFKPRDG